MKKIGKIFSHAGISIASGYRKGMLRFYESCEQRAISMRTKAEYPEQYREHVALNVLRRQLDHLAKKAARKELSAKDYSIVTQAYMLADSLASKQDESPYKNQQFAVELKGLAIELSPDLAMLEKMDTMVEELLAQLPDSPELCNTLQAILGGDVLSCLQQDSHLQS